MNRQHKKYVAKKADYKSLFTSETGKRILYDLMRQYRVMDPVFSSDPMEMAYNEGQRTVVLMIINQMNTDLKKLENQLSEAIKHERFDYTANTTSFV